MSSALTGRIVSVNFIVLVKERKEKGGFIGAEGVQQMIKDSPPRRRVGLFIDGAPARRTSNFAFVSFLH